MLGTLHNRSVHVTIKRGSHWPAQTGRLVGLCLRATLGRRTYVLYVRRVDDFRDMAAEVRAGITFGVELYVPWDAPEAVVDILPEGVVPLRNVPDVIGLVGRREGAAKSCVLQGRDIRSVRVLVPDCREMDQNFHDVTIVDMGEVPESSISILELSALGQQWPPAVLSHMGWRQQELEEMRSVAKQCFRQSRPSSCV